MAYPFMFLLLALLFVASSPLACSLVINGTDVPQINVCGFFVCDQGGNPNPTPENPGIPGVNLLLWCNRGITDAYDTVTRTNGFFQIVVKFADALLFDPDNCFVIVRLPIGRCRLFPPNGNLQAAVNFLNITQTALGPVAYFSTRVFQLFS